MKRYNIEINTTGRGFTLLTDQLNAFVGTSAVINGLCHLFIHHTSASVVICENFDNLVQRDMDQFMCRIAPDGDPSYLHRDEGPDDMPSHIRTMLTQSALTIPIIDGHLGLGRWQGVYLWEHRLYPHHRRITVTIQGE